MNSVKSICSVGVWTISVALAAAAAGCNKPSEGQQPAKPAQMPPAFVAVDKAICKDVPVEIRNFGLAEPYNTVSVKSMVAGAVTDVHFVRGQTIKAGQMLYTIDVRPYEAAQKQCAAALQRDTHHMENAQREANRLGELLKRGAATRDEVDQAQTTAAAFVATVAADRATLEDANVKLSYCYIRSPIEGIAGDILIDKGNVVKANDLAMVNVNQVQPIYVTFTVPQQYLMEIQRESAQRQLKVRVTQAGSSEVLDGNLTFVDNTIDQTTGTIRLKATFANADLHLWPGKYVNVTLELNRIKDATVVPTTAIQSGQQGLFVYTVDANDTVAMKLVKTGLEVQGQTVITEGVEPDQTVVVDGHLRLAPGVKVTTTMPASSLVPGAKPTSEPAATTSSAPAEAPAAAGAEGGQK